MFWGGGVPHMAQHDELVIIHHLIREHCILLRGKKVLQKKENGEMKYISRRFC